MQCAVFVSGIKLPNSYRGGQQVWVFSGGTSGGTVTVVTFRHDVPYVTESFVASDADIVKAEVVPRYNDDGNPQAFTDNTVWIATTKQELALKLQISP